MKTHIVPEWQETHGAHLMELPPYRLQLVVLVQEDGSAVQWVLEVGLTGAGKVVDGIVHAGGDAALKAAKVEALDAAAAYGDRLARLMREERARLMGEVVASGA